MKNKADLYVSVQDYKLNPMEEVNVQVRDLSDDRWMKLDYDKTEERFVNKGLKTGLYELLITINRDDWEDDIRKIKLHEGNNIYFSTLAPKEMMYYASADGEKVYFQKDDSKILLKAQGRNLKKILPDLLKKINLHLEEPIVLPGQLVEEDNEIFFVSVPEELAERKVLLTQLDNIIRKTKIENGLSVTLALPMIRGDVVEGLTNQLIVKFKSDVTDQAAKDIAHQLHMKVLRKVKYLGNAYLWELENIPDYDLLKIALELMKEYPIVYAEPNIIYQLEQDIFTPNDYLYSEQPHYKVIHADDAWDTLDDIHVNMRCGSPYITIAVFDGNGVTPNHPDLNGTLTDGTNKMVANFDFVNWSNQTVAGLSGDHGTQCCSSAAGRFNNSLGVAGLAGNCHLIGARRGGSATTLDIADGWIWAAGYDTGSTNPLFPAKLTIGADVISNSWGGGFTWNNTLKDVLDFLTVYGRGGKGCIVCFSVGNLGYVSFSATRRMASYEKTIAVGASINSNPTNPCNSFHPDHSGNTVNLASIEDTRTFYSPYGLEMDIVAPSHTSYDTSLPGNGVVDPIMAAVRVNQGDWPGSVTGSTTLSSAAAGGATTLYIVSTAGFSIGEYVLIGGVGLTPNETKRITSVGVGQLGVAALDNAYVSGTTVITGPNDYAMNHSVGFGGTSHSCPTVAGAAALILSVRPELTWVQVREILRTTAERIDGGQANAIGRWVDNDGDGIREFSRWYGYGRLDVNAAVVAARDLELVLDVVVRDNLSDTGSVPSSGWHAVSPDIWVRRNDDPIPALAYNVNPPHENAIRGSDNYVFMRVKNVGDAATNEVYLRLMITHFPGFEFRYPDEWIPSNRIGQPVPTPLVTGTYLIGETRIDDLAANTDIIVKMTWDEPLIPPEKVLVGGINVTWHPCLLAEVSPHDGPIPSGTTFDVKRDNNLAQRNIRIEDPEDSGGDLALAVVAGTSDTVGIDSIIIDRSLIPLDYKVFFKYGDDKFMKELLRCYHSGEILPVGPILTEEITMRSGCKLTMLDTTRIKIDCCNRESYLVTAVKGTKVELMCHGDEDVLNKPIIKLDKFQEQDVIVFEGGSAGIEIPLNLNAGEFTPIIVGVMRPDKQQDRGVIKLTQRRSDGELSAGYEVEC